MKTSNFGFFSVETAGLSLADDWGRNPREGQMTFKQAESKGLIKQVGYNCGRHQNWDGHSQSWSSTSYEVLVGADKGQIFHT
jgi:hypothetical protein